VVRLLAGMAVFLGVHSISIVAPAWRDRMVAAIGAGPWKGLYSILSIVGFLLLVGGYAAARAEPVVLYVPPAGLRHVAALVMLPVFPLLLATYLPGRIKSATKHPMLVAVKAWALAHLLANGMLADVVLFGGFLAWAVVDRISMKRRPARPLPAASSWRANDAIAIVGGLAVYAAMVAFLHQRWFGVAPFG
jgi:uncharacterized membrane protein